MAIFQALGPYEIVRRIGKGGMGDVYLAADTRRPEDDPLRHVALKILWHDLERDAPGVLEAERQGAQLQARLYGIDNRVVRVNHFGDLEDCFFIDMEYIAGRDLAELIQRGPVPPLEAARIAIEVADILLKAHTMRFEHLRHDSRGIVHGDVKPRNIRLEASGRVRLMDFGIAKALSMTRKLTRNEFGSVTYASPERLDTGEVNEHSDLWSLAVVLYEMVSGTPPFAGENTRRIEQLIVSRMPPPRSPHIPAPLRPVLDKALAPRLEDRYLTAVHLKKALQAARAELERSGAASGIPQGTPPAEETRRTLVPFDRLREPGPPAGRRDWDVGASQGPLTAAAVPLIDSEATRRTVQSPAVARVADPDATRRTVPPLSDLPEAPEAGGAGSSWVGSSRGALALETLASALDAPASSLEPFAPAQGMPAAEAAPLEAPLQPPAVPAAAGPGHGGGLVRWSPVTKTLVALSTFAAVAGGVSELRMARSIPSLVQEMNGRGVTCEQGWTSYRELSTKSLLHIGLSSMVEPLVQLCTQEAEQVIKRYRTDDPRLIKSDWVRANTATRHVMALMPSPAMDAWEQYTRGHVLRIEKKYDQAKAAYDKAAELDPDFCGPYLALVQMYAYNQPDLQGLLDSRARAAERNCPLGKRQEIQLADAQHRQAEKLFADDRDTDPPAYRREQLGNVRQLLIDAQSVYKRYPTFGDARAHLRSITKRLKEVDERLEEAADLEAAQAPAPITGWGWP